MMSRGLQRCSDKLCFFNLLTMGLFAQVQTSVNWNTFYSNHQHCEFQPGGVRNLDCFQRWGIRGMKAWRCEWQPGVGTSQKTYTLCIQQGNDCIALINTTEPNTRIRIFERNITALVVENPHLQNCTKDIFEATPKDLYRCGPPLRSSFSRHSGNLKVIVTWLQQERNYIQGYTVKYKAMGDLLWKSPKIHKNGSILDSFNSSQAYVAQVKCSNNNKCSQCPWSDSYIIPPELKTKPVLVSLEGVNSPVGGRRMVSLTWKTLETERPDGYCVNIQKASGEVSRDHFNTTHTEITLHLSCSAFIVTITAFNNVSVSPALSQNITRCSSLTGVEAGKLNVTLHSNTSFTVSWEAQHYICYCVELSQTRRTVAYSSFYEDEQSNKTVDLAEPLEPYKRYTLLLHTRPNKDTCNLKRINSSERTYGSLNFYYKEGTPISSPKNISYYNVTSSSLLLQWAQIPEEDLRGFLLGYTIYYKEQNKGEAEKTVTVDAESTSYVIEDLKPKTRYQVQISGYTKAGVGVRSLPTFFKTFEKVYVKDSVIIVVFVATSALLVMACPLLKRTKGVIWPSIPNPENSSAIQKIEKFWEVELLESLQTVKLEEWDTHSLQIIEEAPGRLSLPVIVSAENEEDSPETCSEENQEDAIPSSTLHNVVNAEQAGHAISQPGFTCGYTTLEMFQHAVKTQSNPAIRNEARGKVQDDVKRGPECIGHFSQVHILTCAHECEF